MKFKKSKKSIFRKVFETRVNINTKEIKKMGWKKSLQIQLIFKNEKNK